MPQAVTVTSPLGPGKLVFQRMTGREELGRLFELKLDLLSEDAALKLPDVVGQNITVKAVFTDDRTRYFNGDVTQFRQVSRRVSKYHCYEAMVRPRLWFLTCTSDCRIFQQKSVPDILKLILDEHGITDVRKSLSKTYTAREYCVQYNETDFAFISRLMEEEGIYYYFEHAEGKHTLVLADSISAHAGLPGGDTLPFMIRKGAYAKDHIFDWAVRQQALAGTYVHTDYDFVKPRANLKSQSAISRTHAHAGMELFYYPGSYTESSAGTNIAKTRIEEVQSGWEVIEGKTTGVQFGAGRLFKMSGYAREDQNREHLLVATDYDLQMEVETAAGTVAGQMDAALGVSFECAFTAIHSQRPFRAAATTPKPVVQGPQTAVVVGKSGEEIWTDQYGRVKVQFHWDRLGEKNENSSCWVRVAQMWAGKAWGAMHIPRIGQEVIVEFLEGDPDQPIVTGRVYNADQAVPYPLPASQTQSGLKTRSTKEGNDQTFNELRFEDKKGEEQIYFHAEKNFDRVVENNDTLKVGYDKKDPGDQTVEIYNHRTTTLEKGTDTLTIKEGDRVTSIDKGNQSLTIKEGSRDAKIKTDDTLELESGNQTITIKQGNQTITIEAGKGMIEAATELVLKVGESTVKITPSSIELSSVNIKLAADGQLEAQGAQSKITGTGMLDLDGGMISLN